MLTTDPTPEHIKAALTRAKDLVETRNFDLLRALAEATTTAQCEGVQGFKVFRDVRNAIPGAHLITDRRKALSALTKALETL